MRAKSNAPLTIQVYSTHQARLLFKQHISSLVFLLSLCISCQALAPLVPPNFVAPLCNASSPLLPRVIRVEMGSDCDLSYGDPSDCGLTAPFNNFTIAPATSLGLLLLQGIEKNNPDDVLMARLSFQFNSLATPPPELAYSYYDGVSQVTDDQYVGPQSYVDTSLYITFDRSERSQAPHGFNGFVETFTLLFTPVTWYVNVTQPDLQLSESCSLIVQFQVNCCGSPQKLELVAQPYWILLLSTVTYFFASYFYVYSMVALERLPLWQRTVAKIQEKCSCCQSRKKKQNSALSQPHSQQSSELIEPDALSQSLLDPVGSSVEPAQRTVSSNEDEISSASEEQAPTSILAFLTMIVSAAILYLVIQATERQATSAFKSIASQQLKQISDHSSQANTADTEQQSKALQIHAQQQQVEFPWYSLLLFRVLCTLSVVIFVQTLFNYGIYVYDAVTNYDPNVESDWANQYWLVPISKEFAQRNAHLYWQSIESDMYEKFRALTLLL